jgi:hypothetical protein
MRVHPGGCQCGSVRVEAELDLGAGATRCNCTSCTRVGATSVAVKPDAFRVLFGQDSLTEYRRGTSPNSRFFCKRCGIQVFGRGFVEELGGAYVSVNVNCLDDVELAEVPVGYWDGRHDNWEAGMRREPWPVRARG